jgi:hypothetical protein
VNRPKTAWVVSIIIAEYSTGKSVQQWVEVSLRRQLRRSIFGKQRRDETLLPSDVPRPLRRNPQHPASDIYRIEYVSHPIQPCVEPTSGQPMGRPRCTPKPVDRFLYDPCSFSASSTGPRTNTSSSIMQNSLGSVKKATHVFITHHARIAKSAKALARGSFIAQRNRDVSMISANGK